MTLCKKDNISFFRPNRGTFLARYYSTWFFVIGWFIAYPVLIKGSSYLPIFLYGIFCKDLLTASLFLSIPVFWQAYVTYETSTRIKIMTLKDDFIIIKFYGFFIEKSLKICYKDILSFEYAKDWVKSFIFTMKNGEKITIRADILEKEKAFNLIQQKIKDNKNA